MAGNEDLNVRVSEPTTLDQLTKADLAVISGTAAFSFNKVQIDALRKYIDGGGTLLIEAVGGSQAFSQAGRKLIAKLYPDQPPQVLPASSDVYQLPGRSIRGLPTRNSRRFPGRFPPLSAVAREGRNAIFISDLDLTTALLGVPCLRARGYTPDSAVKLLRNLVILAAGDKVAQPPAADPR
jgi:hypothetical protein